MNKIRELVEQLTRYCLMESEIYMGLLADVDVMGIARTGAIDMSEWDGQDHIDVCKWAYGDQVEMPDVIRNYLDEIREIEQ